MKTCVQVSWVIATFMGATAGVAHFFMADRWARVDATGEPKFEMPTWWMAGESVLAALLLTLLIGGIGAVVSRIRGVRAPSQDSKRL